VLATLTGSGYIGGSPPASPQTTPDGGGTEPNLAPDAGTAIAVVGDLRLVSVEFFNDNRLLHDDGTFNSKGTSSVARPQIQLLSSAFQPDILEPICYSWLTPIKLTATFAPKYSALVGGNRYVKAVATQSFPPAVYAFHGTVNARGGTVTMTSDHPIPKLVANSIITISWQESSSEAGPYKPITSIPTAVPLYVTAGRPYYTNATCTRVKEVCAEANGLFSDKSIIDALWNGLPVHGTFTSDPTVIPDTYWDMRDGHGGQCVDIVNLQYREVRMVGLKPIDSVKYVYPTSVRPYAKSSFSALDSEIRGRSRGVNGHADDTHGPEEWLVYFDFTRSLPPSPSQWGHANNFEACYAYTPFLGHAVQYYPGYYLPKPGGPIAPLSSPNAVMNIEATYSAWQYGTYPNAKGECEAPGPDPQHWYNRMPGDPDRF
jgi:hypothetical protein